MAKRWQLAVVNSWSPSGLAAVVQWTNGVPHCAEEGCPHYDGKRCEAIGMRPSRVCEPTVEAMSELLDAKAAK